MQDLSKLAEGDKVEWDADDEKTVVGKITDKRMETMGSTLTGDKREVLTFTVDILSDDVYDDQMIVDEEMETLRPNND